MRKDDSLFEGVIIGFVIAVILLCAKVAWSAEITGERGNGNQIIDVGRLATAIRKAENSKTKPYGVMRDYCHAGAEAQCRKGCIQTIEKWKKKLDYKSAEEFIRKFGEVYAPVNGKSLTNSERRLNIYWTKNVLFFYNKGD